MTMNTILTTHLHEGRDFTYAWGIFLDEFYRSNQEKKSQLITIKPTFTNDSQLFAFLAASVHKLCRKYHLLAPRWIFTQETYLADPYFPNNPSIPLRKVYLVESPPEFKSRNIFVSENVLSRV